MYLQPNPAQTPIPVEDINLSLPGVPYVPHVGKPDVSRFNWDQRPMKDLLRHTLVSSIGSKKKNLLVMPGSTGRDIELLKYYDVSAANAQWTLVERDINQFQLLRQKPLFSGREKVIPHINNFSTLRSTQNYDFAWFDLLGNLHLYDIYWFRDHFQPNQNLDLFFGFLQGARGPRASTFNILRNTLWYRYPEEMKNIVKQLAPTKQLRESYTKRAQTRSRVFDENIAVHKALFDYILAGWDFKLECWIYEDTVPFLAYKLSNFTRTKATTPVMDHIDLILNLTSSYRGGFEDEQIAEEAAISLHDVQLWKEINHLSPAANDAYEMSEGFETLLLSQEILDITQIDIAGLLCHRLYEFNPYFIETGGECKKTKNGISLVTARGRYIIRISDTIEYTAENSLTIKITPAFLHPDNINALFSVFRCLFRGDEELHPQLSNKVYLDDVGNPIFTLSDPQQQAINAFKASWEHEEKAGIIVLPTGMGKTVVASQIVNWLASQYVDFRVLFLVHREEILNQAINSMKKHTLYSADCCTKWPHTPCLAEKYYCRFYGSRAKTYQCLQKPCIFATPDSLSQPEYLKLISKNHFDLVIVDEAHHINAATWMAIAKKFKNNSYLLGLTATPFRGDEEVPSEEFDNNYLFNKSLNRGIWEGYLSWPDYRIFNDHTDYKRYLGKADSRLIEKIKRSREYLQIVFDTYMREAPFAKTIAFASKIKNAIAASDFFNEQDIASAVITSKTPEYERKNIIDAFEDGVLQVLFSVGIFNEGFDAPDVEAILKLSSTKSPVRAIQQLGRGLRLSPGKRNVVILDFVGNYEQLNSIYNLGIFSNISANQAEQLQKGGLEHHYSPSLSIIPAINFKISQDARLIIRNTIETSVVEKVTRDEKKKILQMCREGYLDFDIQQEMKKTRKTIAKICAGITLSVDVKLLWKLRIGIILKKGYMTPKNIASHLRLSMEEINEILKEIQPSKFRKNFDDLLKYDDFESLMQKLGLNPNDDDMKLLENLLSG